MKRHAQQSAFAVRVDAGNRQKRRRFQRAGREIQDLDRAAALER